MTSLPIIYFAHGIDGNVCNGWERDWEWRVDDHYDAIGESYTYDMNSMQRGSRRQGYADILAGRIKAINANPRYSVLDLVGHSEGTDIITLALKQGGYARNVHLMGGACDASFDENGLNQALRDERVQRVYVYISPDDEVLWAASSFWLWGPALGKAATLAEAEKQMQIHPAVRCRVEIVWKVGYRHSHWVYEHGEETFSKIVKVAGLKELEPQSALP